MSRRAIGWAWEGYRSMYGGLTPDQFREIQRAFYAGAAALYMDIHDNISVMPGEDEKTKAFDEVGTEISEFALDVVKGIR